MQKSSTENGGDGNNGRPQELPRTDHRTLALGSFEPWVGSEFVVRDLWDAEGNSVSLPLRLAEATGHRLHPSDGRAIGRSGEVRTDPFSLLFVGPDDRRLVQGTYRLDHEGFDGGLSLFLVPVGPGGEGMQYESTFS